MLSSTGSPSAAVEDWPLLADYERPVTTRLDYVIANTPSIELAETKDRKAAQEERKQKMAEEDDNFSSLPSRPSAGFKRKSSERKQQSPPFRPTFRGGGEEEEEEEDKMDEEHMQNIQPDDLYDPDLDDRDEERLGFHHLLSSHRISDAILSCPHCFTTLCLDCQAHETFPHQYRAMFVQHCRIVEKRVLPSREMGGGGGGVGGRGRMRRGRGQREREEEEEVEKEESGGPYFAVCCDECGTEVAVLDVSDEIYHFCHVLDSAGNDV